MTKVKTLPPLWVHQKNATDKAGSHAALFFDPGTGKTRTAIELYKNRNKDEGGNCYYPDRVLILAPLNVCRNWEIEIEEYLQQKHKCYVVSGQTKVKKLKIFKEFLDERYPVVKNQINGEKTVTMQRREPMFLICNIEVMRTREYIDIIKKSGIAFIIIDESHNFKTPSSRQTKGLLEVVRKLRPSNLLLLTGTPAPQGEIDLWSTFRLLNKTDLPFFVWRKKYFEDVNEARRGMNNYWPEYKITPEGRKYFQELLDECSFTAHKNEVLDLPPLLRVNLYVEMTAEQKRHYDTMKEYLFAIDEAGNELNASNVLSRTLRLQQILAGFIGEAPIKNNGRMAALKEAIDLTNGEQFIIWTIFKATYVQISKYLDNAGLSFGMLTGEQTAEERFEAMEAFQAGKLRCLIAHPRAGGVGVNLTAASYSIHYTKNFNLVDDLQCEARNYRGGSERHERITRIDIITPGTIDEDITLALKNKKTVQDFILGLKEKK